MGKPMRLPIWNLPCDITTTLKVDWVQKQDRHYDNHCVICTLLCFKYIKHTFGHAHMRIWHEGYTSVYVNTECALYKGAIKDRPAFIGEGCQGKSWWDS